MKYEEGMGQQTLDMRTPQRGKPNRNAHATHAPGPQHGLPAVKISSHVPSQSVTRVVDVHHGMGLPSQAKKPPESSGPRAPITDARYLAACAALNNFSSGTRALKGAERSVSTVPG